MASGKSNSLGFVLTANWIAASSAAYATALTDEVTLPDIGNYLILIKIPIVTSGSVITGIAGSDFTRYAPSDNFINCTSYNFGAVMIKATASGAKIKLQTWASTSVAFDYIDRGGLQVIKIG